jgi:preprotein translocase SecE subunit
LVKEKKQKKIVSVSQKKRAGAKTFFQDLQVELKRVHWPDRKTVANATVVILIIVLFITVFVASIDVFFSKAIFSLKGFLHF